MGKVHHADDAEHHRVADGDESVDGTERDPVDQLLEKNIHAAGAFDRPSRPTADSEVLTGPCRGGNATLSPVWLSRGFIARLLEKKGAVEQRLVQTAEQPDQDQQRN